MRDQILVRGRVSLKSVKIIHVLKVEALRALVRAQQKSFFASCFNLLVTSIILIIFCLSNTIEFIKYLINALIRFIMGRTQSHLIFRSKKFLVQVNIFLQSQPIPGQIVTDGKIPAIFKKAIQSSSYFPFHR